MKKVIILIPIILIIIIMKGLNMNKKTNIPEKIEQEEIKQIEKKEINKIEKKQLF